MTSTDTVPDGEMYRRLYMTRPLSMGLPRVLLTLALLPALSVLALVRLLFFCFFNTAYLVLPARARRLLFGSEWLYRLVLFLTVGIVFRAPSFRADNRPRKRLVVMNHHGVQDIFLFRFIQRLGATRLVVSYEPAYYARVRRWFFFFDHDFDIVSVAQRRKIINTGPNEVTMAFPEGAGKKGPFVLSFQPALFRLHEEVSPFAVSFKPAIPLMEAYGVDLPWHKSMCFVLLVLTPWTVVTVRQLPTIAYDRDRPSEAAEKCRELIAKATGYRALNFFFDQRAFDACLGHPVDGSMVRRRALVKRSPF